MYKSINLIFYLAKPHANTIRNAAKEIEAVSCVKFLLANATTKDYIILNYANTEVNRPVGYAKNATTYDFYHKGGIHKGYLIFILMKALGFHEMQQSYNRDLYVKIQFENVKSSALAFFDIKPYTDHLLDIYEYGSIMHRGPNFMSKNGQPTIVANTFQIGSQYMGQNKELSVMDIKKLNNLYDCKVKTKQQTLRLIKSLLSMMLD